MKEGHKTIKEILLEVAKEEGMTEREIKDLWAHQKKIIVDRMKSPDVYAIFIPFIGTLSLNTKQFRIEKRGKNYFFYKKFIAKVKNLLEKEDFKKYGNAHKKRPNIHNLLRYIFKTFNVDFEMEDVRNRHSKMWEVIAKYSNGKYEKK